MASLATTTMRDLSRTELSEPGARNPWKSNPVVVVDTSATLISLVDTLTNLEKSPGSIYMDLEGIRLSRYGSISIIQILIPSREQVFIVDVHILGAATFDILGSEGKSLKDALESVNIKKYLFDVRNDSDALFALFGVRLANVIDVQLLELASRRGPKHVVYGLAKCIEQEQALPSLALSEWQITKKEVVEMFDPSRGGTYEVFNARPLPQALIDYCVGDVESLPLLSKIYQSRLDNPGLEEVQAETEKRLNESWSENYEPKGRHKSFGPKNWRYPPKKEKKPTQTATAWVSNKGKNPIAPVAAPVTEKGGKSTATVLAPVPQEKEKATTVVSAPTPKKGKKPTATMTIRAPKRGKRPNSAIGAAASKKEETARVGGSTSKRRDKPSAVSTPSKEGKSIATATPPASAKGKTPIATVPAPVPKIEKKSSAIVAASATYSVPDPLASQDVLIQPTFNKLRGEWLSELDREFAMLRQLCNAKQKPDRKDVIDTTVNLKNAVQRLTGFTFALYEHRASADISENRDNQPGGPNDLDPDVKQLDTRRAGWGLSTITQSTYQGELRYQPVAFVPEGSRKSKSRRPATPSYEKASSTVYDDNEQNYAICDKGCGWCGHCGDGII